MRISRVAIRYSKASLEYAIEKKVSNHIKNDFKNILSAISNSDELKELISNPIISSKLKFKILCEVFSDLTEDTKSIIFLLSKNRRLSILSQVAEDFIFRLKKSEGRTTAIITTAISLNEELKKIMYLKAKQMTTLEVEIENKIDPSIVGGFIINVGDKELNASISSQLESLNRRLISNKNIA
ncbi:MAG: ATP synthase F1 subunit delta [Flavobacteriaceae bacterium]|jgi:F-type H+-transporting ATPase subunit delta|nr:ATP synthase F1 subunit delta [Flavobacteriaceae bacterium]|tara:strand:- start:887 stop:1435 length:549 start_codon:yes stop_codon:yes gene_type:complete